MKPVLQANHATRIQFKKFNKFMIVLWRLGLGGWVNFWPEKAGQVLVLVHRGRKTGALRRTPVNYAEVNGDLYVTAGFGAVADWYRNLKADPKVEVWLPDSWWAGEAEEIVDPLLRLLMLRKVLVASGFAAYAAGIDPIKMSDAEVDAQTKDYRVLRIRKVAPRTGPGGPGDLNWVWVVATFFLLAKLLQRRRK
jgi:deazaflavin-dependent oxidoreductase (nitroreductase family)